MIRRPALRLPAIPLLALSAATAAAADVPVAACFAPGTSPRYVEEIAARIAEMGAQLSLTVQPPTFQFRDTSRWTETATDGRNLRQGDPTTITWSIVPDGTRVDGFIGEGRRDSELEAFLDGIYGSRVVWLGLFDKVFDRWSELNGVTYVFQPTDDGAAMTTSGLPAGELGVRGDVRIAGHQLDGTGGVLAYNFFPDNGGDMVIDTTDTTFNDTAADSLFLRNAVAHEHGHGLGLEHVCPANQTKLMEPFISRRYDGPQHDDILATNRGYGDRFEVNDTRSRFTDLGSIGVSSTLTETNLSLDNDLDLDYLRFDVTESQQITLILEPNGRTYLSGRQNSNGSCSPGSSFDSLAIRDLALELLNSSGITILASSDSGPAGATEEIVRFDVTGPASYFARVTADTVDEAQLYDLTIRTEVPFVPPTVYESLLDRVNIVTAGNEIGTAFSSPFQFLPDPGAILYYQVTDGAGNPAVILMVEDGPTDLRIVF